MGQFSLISTLCFTKVFSILMFISRPDVQLFMLHIVFSFRLAPVGHPFSVCHSERYFIWEGPGVDLFSNNAYRCCHDYTFQQQ